MIIDFIEHFNDQPFDVFRSDNAAIVVDGEVLYVENPLVADVAKELLLVFVQSARVQRDATLKAFDAAPMVGFSVSRHHLKMVEHQTASKFILAYLFGGKDACLASGAFWRGNGSPRHCLESHKIPQDCDALSLGPTSTTSFTQLKVWACYVCGQLLLFGALSLRSSGRPNIYCDIRIFPQVILSRGRRPRIASLVHDVPMVMLSACKTFLADALSNIICVYIQY